MHPILRSSLQIVIAGFVLMACILGIYGSVAMSGILFGVDLNAPGSKLSLIEMILGCLFMGLGALLTGIGAMTVLSLLIFKFPELGKPMFGRIGGKFDSALLGMIGNFGAKLQEYAIREQKRLEVKDDSNHDI